MTTNILDMKSKGRSSDKECEGYTERITLTTFASNKGLGLQLTLGGYPYMFIIMDKKKAKKLRDKLNKYIED